MTDDLERVRAVARLLPAVEEHREEGEATFRVAGAPFALCGSGDDAVLRLRDEGDSGWWTIRLGPDADWAAIEDAIARSWELAAPADLLEAGGR